MKKKSLATLLIGIMTLTSLLAGCGEKVDPTDALKATDAPKATETDKQADAPTESAEPQKITIALQAHQTVTDYENNTLTNYIEDQCNCEIEFVMLPVDKGEAATKISLLLAEGKDIPDIFVGGLDAAAVQQYGAEGYFLDVSEYVADPAVMPHLNAALDMGDNRDVYYQSTKNIDGTIYGFATIAKPSTANEIQYCWWINQKWLDYLGLEVPTNLEELKEVLIAFRDGDPNQNGIKDEMPLYATINSGNGRNTLDAIINCFTYFAGNRDENSGLAVENGKVNAVFASDAYKEALLYMAELYDEGLIPDNVFTDTQEQWKANCKLDPNVVGICTVTGGETDLNTNEMTYIPLLEGPDGISYTPHMPRSFTTKMAISADTDNVELCLKIADLFYSKEGTLITRYGTEDVHWTRDTKLMIEYGADPEYIEKAMETYTMAKLCDLWQENHNGNWRGVGVQCITEDMKMLEFFGPDSAETKESNTLISGGAQYLYDDWREDNMRGHCPDEVLPVLKYSTEELDEIGEIIVNIDEHVWVSLAQFVKGDRDIEKEWDSYLAELDNMGLEQWLATAQVAYNRMK